MGKNTSSTLYDFPVISGSGTVGNYGYSLKFINRTDDNIALKPDADWSAIIGSQTSTRKKITANEYEMANSTFTQGKKSKESCDFNNDSDLKQGNSKSNLHLKLKGILSYNKKLYETIKNYKNLYVAGSNKLDSEIQY